MKKNLLLILFYIIEAIFLIFFLVPDLRNMIIGSFPFMENAWVWLKESLSEFLRIINLSGYLQDLSSRTQNIISLLIINLGIFIIYEILVAIILFFVRRHRKKKLIANNLDTYTLTEEEKARFEWKLYLRSFSWKGLVSFLIPTIFILSFVLLRYDHLICQNDPYQTGYFDFYNFSIRPFLNSLSSEITTMIESGMHNYIAFINTLVSQFELIEFILLGISALIIYLFWFFIVWVFKKIFRRRSAKKRAKKAKRKYIARMEERELKAKKSAGGRISSKAQEVLGELPPEVPLYTDAGAISIVNNEFGFSSRYNNPKEASYIDDIATGVVDLGVASTGEEEEKEPIEKRIPVFVGDEDIDISLESEPVIETIEEEEEGYYEEEDDPFYEKYHPEDIDTTYLDESFLIHQIEVEDEEEKAKDEALFTGIQDFSRIDNEPKNVYTKPEIIIKEEKAQDNVPPVEAEIIVEETPAVEEEIIVEETPAIVEEETLEVIIDEPIETKKPELVKPLKPIIVKKEKTFKAITPINVVKREPFKKDVEIKSHKKPIGPIQIKKKFDEKERFRNAKKKYLEYPLKKETIETTESKKRNLKRRRHGK